MGTNYHVGLGLRNLHGEQGTQQSLTLKKHLRLCSSLGMQLNVAIQTHQIHAGLEKPILEDTASLSWLDHPWMDRLREFLFQTDAKIKLTDA